MHPNKSSPESRKIKVRSQSARVSSAHKTRPLSGKSSVNLIIKADMIESIYVNKNANSSTGIKNKPSKSILYQGITTEQLNKYKRPQANNAKKGRQQLFQQNMQLKRQMNEVKNQLTILKGKYEASGKKKSKSTKQLNRQFQRQIYWDSSTNNKSHLISGIKHQYQKLKLQYNEQSKELKLLKVNMMESRIPEHQVYVTEIESQNKRLVRKIQELLAIQQTGGNDMKDIDQLASKKQNKILVCKLEELDIKLRAANQNLIEKDRKNQFLQKLIIEKDNKQYHALRKFRKAEKGKMQVQANLQTVKEQMMQDRQQWENSAIRKQSKHKQDLQKMQKIHQQEIKEKNQTILLLEGKIRQLQTVINKLRVHSVKAVNQKIEDKSALKFEDFNSVNSKKQNSAVQLSYKEKEEEKQENAEVWKNRKVKKAHQRHSEEAEKTRKIRIQEIQEICELMHFRVIGSSMHINEVKMLFDYDEKQDQKEDEKNWKKQYMTMQQALKILLQKPFCLEQSDAWIVARYVIEDCEEEYVYCDIGNQNNRSIVKSITKTIIGEYQKPDEQIYEQQKHFMQKYRNNLESALCSYYPMGKTTRSKFESVMRTIGVQLSDKLKHYLIGKMVIHSSGLEELEYEHLFLDQQE